MAPSPQCAALAAAIQRKGVTYGQIASQIGSSEQRVIAVVTGTAQPTRTEFDSLARVLGITDQVPMSPAHKVAF